MSDEPSEPEIAAEQVAEEFLDRLHAGDQPDREAVLAAHPDIDGKLKRRLGVVELLHRVGRKGAGSASTSTERPLLCPHCTNPIRIKEPGSDEVTCPSCHNPFRVSRGSLPAAGGDLPAKIGRFEVLGLLGRGAFGAVYRARDPELHRTVAVKVPRASFFGTKEEEERFLREARSAAGLDHPGVVRVHEIGEEKGLPYLVTEYIEGRTLVEVISHREASFQESARLVQRIAEILQSAHSQKVIHRDVKPGNILIDRQGLPHLSDFGLARHAEEAVAVTLDGQILGTPAYMSPEQASGDQSKVGFRSDLYSLGVVLYELLTGERPFRGSRSMLVHQVLHEEPRPPRSLNQHIPRDLETVCLKAMAKEPRGRYPSARLLADDLGRFLRGEPVRARPVGRAERLWRRVKRNPVQAGLAAAVAVLLVAVAVVATVMAVHTARARNDARAQLSRLNAATGMRLADAGDLFDALPRLAESLRLDREDPLREEADRLRLEAVLDRCPRLVRVVFHPKPVIQAEFSPDDRLLAAVSGNRLEVLDFESGEVLFTTGEAEGAVTHFAFSPVRSQLAVGSQSGAVHLLSPRSGEHLAKPMAHRAGVRQVIFSPDGRFLATASADRTGRVWDVSTGEAVTPPLEHANDVLGVHFSPDGRLVSTASRDGTARIWEASTGKAVAGPLRHGGAIREAVFSPDSRRVVTASDDRTGAVWEIASGKTVAVLREHYNRVFRASFSPDGRLVLTASFDRNVRLWEADTGKQLLAISHGLGVPHAFFSPDGRTVLSVGYDGSLRLTRVPGGEPAMPPVFNQAGLHHAALSASGRWIATSGGDGTLRVWDRAGGEPAGAIWRHGTGVGEAWFSPDGKQAVTVSHDGTAKVWDVSTGRLAARPLVHIWGVSKALFSPEGRRVATLTLDSKVRLWDLGNSEPLARPLEHPTSVRGLVWSPDGLRLATACGDRSARIWDTKSGDLVIPPVVHPKSVARVAFSPDGSRLLTACDDGFVRLWDASRGGAALVDLDNKYPLYCASFSPGGDRIVAGSAEVTATLWDAVTGAPIGAKLRHTSPVVSALFSPDGRSVVTGSMDGTARVWSALDGRPVSSRLVSGGATVWVDFSPDGRRVATASEDGTGRLWDIASGEEAIPPVRHQNLVFTVQVSPDGRHLLTSSHDGTATLTSLPAPTMPVDDAVELAHLLSGRRVDATGSVVDLDPADFRKAWEALRFRHPDRFRASPESVAAWHRREAAECEDAGEWSAALRQLEPLLQADPGDWEIPAFRGRICAKRGNPEEGVVSFRRAVSLECLDPQVFEEGALTALVAGDLESYRWICRRLVDRFGTTANAGLLNTVSWICALGPRSTEELAGLANRFEAALKTGPRIRPALNTLGAVLYRAGDFVRAVERLQESRELAARDGDAEDWLFLGMALQGQGRREEAAQALEKGIALAGEVLAETDRGPRRSREPMAWTTRVSLTILRKEAEALKN